MTVPSHASDPLHRATRGRSAAFWLTVNSASGSYDETRLRLLLAAFGEAALPDRVIDCQDTPLPGRAELEAAGVARVAVFGGDGTLSAYLGRLEGEGWPGAVLPLPGGTQNLLCRALHGDRPAVAIAAQLARGTLAETRRACLRCGDRTALAEILAGPGARWADVREDLREGRIAGMVGKALALTGEAANGPLVRIADPPTGRDDGYPGVLCSVAERGMTVRGYHIDTLGEWVEQGAAIAARDFREGPHDDLGSLDRAVCRTSDGSRIDLMIDGEHHEGAAEVIITHDAFGLTLLSAAA